LGISRDRETAAIFKASSLLRRDEKERAELNPMLALPLFAFFGSLFGPLFHQGLGGLLFGFLFPVLSFAHDCSP
jgi:hypothetical protein